MVQKCLIIADDLTGGADAGAQFAKTGLNTLLISIKDSPRIDFSKYNDRDVLVVNTDSRGLTPGKAFSLVSNLLKGYDKEIFPIVYKKIDSTLRGNIGYEIDAILKETNSPVCFMAPSYPEQNRTLVGGIMMVGEKPLALTEAAHDAASPVQESHVSKLLHLQSHHKIGRIDLTHVASSRERLQKTVEEERKRGNKIFIFDAVSRRDLTNIADVAFCMNRTPLFVGSAGLAEEVAKKLSPSEARKTFQAHRRAAKPFKHIFIISGSASSVTHQQLKRAKERNIPEFQLNKPLLTNDTNLRIEEKEFSYNIANSLSEGHAILRTYPEMLLSKDSTGLPIHLKITKTLASIALSALKESKVDAHDLAFILTGGDTALSVINVLGTEGIEIEGELLEGIVEGHLIGGNWDGLTVITKAGAFGKENALEKIIEILETGILSSNE